MTGNICELNVERHFGFIVTPQGRPHIFFHFSDVSGDPELIEVGTLMQFELISTPKGLRAVRVEVVDTDEEAERAAHAG